MSRSRTGGGFSFGGWFSGNACVMTLDIRQSHRKNPARGWLVPAIQEARTASETPQLASTQAGDQPVIASRSSRSSGVRA